MLKRITRRISEIGVGKTPVGSIFLLIVFGLLAIIVLGAYWYAVDLIPRWVDKIAFIAIAVTAYGYHSRDKELRWLERHDYLSFRVELLCSDLERINFIQVDFGIVGKIGANGTQYAEISTGKVEKATAWRERLDSDKRPYKYVTAYGVLPVNNPNW